MDELEEKKRLLREWTSKKRTIACSWINLSQNSKNIRYSQGEVVMCYLGENIGYEINKLRPCLVVSDSHYNCGQLIVAPLTKNTRPLRTHYILKENKYTFLEYDSCVKLEQVRSVSTKRINRALGRISDNDLNKVKTRLKTVFNV